MNFNLFIDSNIFKPFRRKKMAKLLDDKVLKKAEFYPARKALTQFKLKPEGSRTEVSRIENSLKNIEFYTIVKLAEALDVTLEEFF